jgi:hypothetical protein
MKKVDCLDLWKYICADNNQMFRGFHMANMYSKFHDFSAKLRERNIVNAIKYRYGWLEINFDNNKNMGKCRPEEVTRELNAMLADGTGRDYVAAQSGKIQVSLYAFKHEDKVLEQFLGRIIEYTDNASRQRIRLAEKDKNYIGERFADCFNLGANVIKWSEISSHDEGEYYRAEPVIRVPAFNNSFTENAVRQAVLEIRNIFSNHWITEIMPCFYVSNDPGKTSCGIFFELPSEEYEGYLKSLKPVDLRKIMQECMEQSAQAKKEKFTEMLKAMRQRENRRFLDEHVGKWGPGF